MMSFSAQRRPSLTLLQRAAPALLVALALSIGGGCPKSGPTSKPMLRTQAAATPLPDGSVVNFIRSQGARAQNTAWDDFELVGARSDASASAGGAVTLTLWWRLLTDAPSDVPKVFVHAREPAAKFTVAQADHAMPDASGASGWKQGDIVQSSVDVKVPKKFKVDTLELMAGLYVGKERFKVDRGPHEKDDRVLVATVAIKGGKPALPTVVASRVRDGETLAIDGVLDEDVWKRAQRVGPFIRHDGKTRIRRPTHAKLAWDKEHLYVAFECDDADAFTPYKKRDDPLYNSEAVEIFIDADGDRDEYVELQAAPNDLQFDAAFKGGARKNFDTKYNADYTTVAKVDGTVNDNSDEDKGWVSEWKISIASLRDIPSPPAVGAEWKINLFRLERIRKGAKVVRNEATAWSSPLSGDFHNLRRFGTLRFGE